VWTIIIRFIDVFLLYMDEVLPTSKLCRLFVKHLDLGTE